MEGGNLDVGQYSYQYSKKENRAGKGRAGDGAASGSAVRTPLATDTSLQHELHRQRVDGVTLQPDEISAMYVTTLAKETLAGQTINEVALYDEDGDLLAIKSFSDKGKDGDMEMVFEILDKF